MFLASTIEIVEQSSLKLVIFTSPIYIRGILCSVGALTPLTAAVIYTVRRYDYARSIVRNFAALIAAVCLAAPLGFATTEDFSSSMLTFSGQTGQLIMDKTSYGFLRDRYSIPLSEISRVTVEPTGPNAYNLRFVLNSGRSFIVSGHMHPDVSTHIGPAMNSFVATN